MAADKAALTLSQKEILDFLGQTVPFDELNEKERKTLAGKVRVAEYTAGSTILKRGKSEIIHLSLIISGRVKLFITDEEGVETVFSLRSTGQAFGALGILRESRSNLDVVALEDTVCLLLVKEAFSQALRSNARFAHFYLKMLSEGYVGVALSRLRRQSGDSNRDGSMLLFGAQVGDVVRRRPVTISTSDPIQRAAELMISAKVGSLLVTDQSEEPVGIITDRDLRKVVAQGKDFSAPTGTIMTSPLRTIPSHTGCFDALLEMIKRRVHHLVMEKNGQIEGVLSGHDLMMLQGSSPLNLVREINQVAEIEDLYDLALRSPRVMHSLILEGAKPGNITRLITLVNDHILDKLLNFLQKQMGPPPAPYCWLLMGSEGRKEQTFKTDQDNGLVYADPKDKKQADKCARYFAALGNEATRHLVNCGFPLCKGEIMASNPKWCQPLSVWKGYFDHWVSTPEPKDVLHATIFLIFGPATGPWNWEKICANI